MKKILSISVIAMMAAAPAFAARDAAVAVANYTAGGSATNLATTSYVQGAYEAASDRIDALVTDTAVAAKANNGTYAAIVAGDSVSENLVHLDDKIGTTTFEGASVSAAINALQTSAGNLGTGKVDQEGNFTGNTDSDLIKNKTVVNAIKDTAAQVDTNKDAIGTIGSLAGDATGEQNLVAAINAVDTALDGRLDTVEGDITTLKNTAATTGSVLNSVKTQSEGADYTTGGQNGSGLSATTIGGAIDEVEGRVDGLESRTTVANGTYNHISQGNNVNTNLVALDTAIGNLNNTASNTYQTLSDSNVAADGNHITEGQGVGANLVALDDAVEVIENKQIPIVSSWSTNTVTYTEIKNLTSGN